MHQSRLLPLGIFLLVAAVYVAVGPGRIDIIDGQYRFEVARNIVDDASVQIRDPYLPRAVPGILVGAYSPYGLSGSIVALPLMLLARLHGPPSIDRDQFFFSFTSAVLGAATAVLLFVFCRRLGAGPRRALGWTFVSAFATLVFYGATTVFDQMQHAFFVLAACVCASEGARRDSMRWVVAGGAAVAVLVNFQETYAVLIPTLGLATLDGITDPARRRRTLERYAVFVFVAAAGLLFYGAFNNFRFGSLPFSGKGIDHPSAVGNPLIGLPGLLVSPGKSIFLYSPATIVALLGVRRLFVAHPTVGLTVVATAAMHLALISMVSFYGGDWCWGPRYFVTTLPLLAVAYPFVRMEGHGRRLVVGTLIGCSVLVQLLGLSLDPHRFFFARRLPAFFWYTDRTFYFRDSALFARPGEIVDSIRNGVPAEAGAFRPGPYPSQLTYAVFGLWAWPNRDSATWMRRYAVFWLPRPWPLWMRWVPAEQRPIRLATGLTVLAIMGAAGAALIGGTLRGAGREEPS